MTDTLNDELIETLEDMARQYLSDIDGNIMTHDFMIAGERCLDVLTSLGRVKTDDEIHYTWVEELTDV